MSKTKVTLGLINPKSPSNVGAVMRAAGCYRVAAVFHTGKRFARSMRFHTDTKDASWNIPLTGVDDLLGSLPDEARLVCVDFAEGATPLPEYRHPDKAFYIFGPEDGTISQKIIDRADAVVYVPTVGSMNLAATVNVVLYDRLAKSSSTGASNELIRQSRDNNNRLQVKGRKTTQQDEQ